MSRGYRALVFDARQISDRLLAERSTKLLDAMALQGTPDEDQEAIQGELLYLAGVRYFQGLNIASDTVAGLHRHVLPTEVGEALLYQDFETPFLPGPAFHTIDVRWYAWQFLSIDGNDSRTREVERLVGTSSSALEHQVWEEVLQQPAMSTIKGLQYAAELDMPIYHADQSNSELSKVNGLGFLVLAIAPDLSKGRVITIHQDPISYDQRRGDAWQWRGHVWISEDPTGEEPTGYYIGGSARRAPTQSNQVPTLAHGGSALGPVTEWLNELLAGVEDMLGEPPDGCSSGGQPVTYANGNMYHQFTDIVIPTRGPALELVRTYNAQSEEDGPFGYGWTHTYQAHLTEALTTTGNVVYTNDSGGRYEFIKQADGSYTSPYGLFLTLTKTADGFDLRNRYSMVQRFDTAGKLMSITDRNGNAQTLGYSGSGQLTSVTDALGRGLTLSYTDSGRIESITDFAGRTWSYTYDSNGDLVASTTPADDNTPAYTTTYSYYTEDPWQHNLKTITDPRGEELTFTYYSDDRAFQTIEPEGKTTTYYYLPFQQKTQVVTERGFVWTYHYNNHGFVTQIDQPDGNTVLREWDDAGNLVTYSDAAGYTSSMTYDERGNMLSVTDPLDQVTTFTYDPTFSQMTGMTDARGNTTSYSIDAANGNILNFSDPLGNITSLAYDSTGNLTAITNANNHTISFTYDANDYPATFTDGRGNTWSLTYDELGRLTATTNPLGDTTTMQSDALGRPLQATDGEGNVTKLGYELGYDGGHNLISMTDANGNTTTYTYDGLNNLTSITDALGNVTQFGYESVSCAGCSVISSNLTALTDGNGHTRHFTYDELDRMVKETDALGRSVTYSYDAQGNVTELTDQDGNTTTYRYDALGRLLQTTFPDDSAETFTYDAVGNLLTATNADTTLTYVYDERDLLTQVTDSALDKTIGYGYDAARNQTTLTAPDERTVTYAYNENDNLAALTDFNDVTTALSYDEVNRLTQIAPQAGQTGVRASYRYDNANRLIGLTNASADGATTFIDFVYTLDAVGNLTAMTATGMDAFAGLLGDTSYTYDAIYRLTDVTLPDGPAQNFVYDPSGNREQFSLVGDALTTSFHDESNRLTYGGADGSTLYTYDQRGNLQTKTVAEATTTYHWDYENQLTRIDYPDGTSSSYSYDAFGRRSSKTLPDGETIRYLYDGLNILQEYDAAGSTRATYVHTLGLDHPLSMERGGETYYYMYDRLGSVIGLSDGADSVQASYVYDVWGNTIGGDDGSIENPYRYTGREYDTESGLYYYRARYYSPQMGRFISQDPIGLASGDANFYAYVGNNPVNSVDPLGLVVSYEGHINPDAVTARRAAHPLMPTLWGSMCPLCHEHIYFLDADGNIVDNVGYGPGGMFKYTPEEIEALGKFEFGPQIYGVKKVIEKLNRASHSFQPGKWLPDGSSYVPVGHNCQDFAQDVTSGTETSK
jgi:RHS repeat-associated protein